MDVVIVFLRGIVSPRKRRPNYAMSHSSSLQRRCKMDEIELPTSGETPEERQRWIVGLCMEMAFAHTQVPYEVIAAGIEAASVVLSPFEGGRRGEVREGDG
jgi:hypothetical protein